MAQLPLFEQFRQFEDARNNEPCSKCGAAIRWAHSMHCAVCVPWSKDQRLLVLVDWPQRPHWVDLDGERRQHVREMSRT